MVGEFIDAVLAPKGLARHNYIRKLFRLSQEMSETLFIKSLRRAHTYGVKDLEAIARIAQIYLNDSETETAEIDMDEGYRDRESYREGALTDIPDLSIYADNEGEGDEGDDAASA
jgi:hypothetical protein